MINYSADKILMISNPGDLFTSPESASSEYKSLMKIWHPDINNDPKSTEVVKKLNELYSKACIMIKNNEWSRTGRTRISGSKPIDINYIHDYSFEFGHVYICRNSLIYHFKSEYRKYADRFKYITENFKFADNNMKERMKYFYPTIYKTIEVDDGVLVLVDKNIRLIRLRDILDYYNGKIPHRHMAWIVSSLLNLACFIQYNGLSHNAITIDNYYIDPTDHNGVLAGGWWFATDLSRPLLGAPRDVFEVMPGRAKAERIGLTETDLESIKLIGRILIGDKYGMDFKNRDPDIPDAIVQYLNSPVCSSAYDEYSVWSSVLTAGYGKREFIKMNVRTEDIYNV